MIATRDHCNQSQHHHLYHHSHGSNASAAVTTNTSHTRPTHLAGIENNDSSSPLVILRRPKTASHYNDNTMRVTRHNAFAMHHHRRSLSESDLLNEIDNALVFSKGFLYSYGKWKCVCCDCCCCCCRFYIFFFFWFVYFMSFLLCDSFVSKTVQRTIVSSILHENCRLHASFICVQPVINDETDERKKVIFSI